jgi:hemoglobin-like flavoprotein
VTPAADVAKTSYARCAAGDDFFAAFYQRFFRACPDAEPFFAQTDFERQHRLLRHAVGLLLAFPGQPAAEPGILTRLAERHSRRDLAVPPAFYGPFIDSLVATVAAHDPQFSPAVEQAWRATLAPGIAYLSARY